VSEKTGFWKKVGTGWGLLLWAFVFYMLFISSCTSEGELQEAESALRSVTQEIAEIEKALSDWGNYIDSHPFMELPRQELQEDLTSLDAYRGHMSDEQLRLEKIAIHKKYEYRLSETRASLETLKDSYKRDLPVLYVKRDDLIFQIEAIKKGIEK